MLEMHTAFAYKALYWGNEIALDEYYGVSCWLIKY